MGKKAAEKEKAAAKKKAREEKKKAGGERLESASLCSLSSFSFSSALPLSLTRACSSTRPRTSPLCSARRLTSFPALGLRDCSAEDVDDDDDDDEEDEEDDDDDEDKAAMVEKKDTDIDLFVIIASDGIWDVMQPQDAIDFVYEKIVAEDMAPAQTGASLPARRNFAILPLFAVGFCRWGILMWPTSCCLVCSGGSVQEGHPVRLDRQLHCRHHLLHRLVVLRPRVAACPSGARFMLYYYYHSALALVCCVSLMQMHSFTTFYSILFNVRLSTKAFFYQYVIIRLNHLTRTWSWVAMIS